MKREEVLERLQIILEDQLGNFRDEFTEDTRLRGDFNADSLDLVEIVMEIEEEFGINIDDDSDDSWRVHEDWSVGQVIDIIEKLRTR